MHGINTMNYQVVVAALIKQEQPEISVDLPVITKEKTSISQRQVERKVLFHIPAFVSSWVQDQFPVSTEKILIKLG